MELTNGLINQGLMLAQRKHYDMLNLKLELEIKALCIEE